MGKPVPMLWGCTSLRRAGTRGTCLEKPCRLWGTGRGADPSRDAWKAKQNLPWRTTMWEWILTLKQPIYLGMLLHLLLDHMPWLWQLKFLVHLDFQGLCWQFGEWVGWNKYCCIKQKNTYLANLMFQNAGSRGVSSVLPPWGCSQLRAGQPGWEGGRERSWSVTHQGTSI